MHLISKEDGEWRALYDSLSINEIKVVFNGIPLKF